MSQTSKLTAALSFLRTSSPDGGVASAEQGLTIQKTLANGTSNGQANLGWYDERTLASNTSENLDLSGTLTDVFGATIAAAEIAALILEADEANTTNITYGNHASAAAVLFFGAATHTLIQAPGDFALLYAKAGWPITATTADLLKVANANGASAVYRVGFLGRNA